MAKENPLLLGQDLGEVALDFDGVGFFGEIETAADALHMGIDHYAAGYAVDGA